MRTNKRPIAIIRRSCSDSSVTASQRDRVFRSDMGVIGLKHLVFFDEIANTRFDDAEASISVLKDYMQTGKFSRGDQEFSSSCSVILGGNIETNVELRQPESHYSHLFQVLPVELQDP